MRAPTSIGTDLTRHVARFRTEDKAREYLEQLRWPDGVRCPRCDATEGIYRIERRGQFDCHSCGYQFSVRAGTSFHASHLPLWKWLLAVYVMCESERGVSANELKRMLGVSYKTAWYLCHRIRAVMKDEAPDALREIVEAAEPPPGPADAGGVVGPMHWLFERSIVGSYRHLSAKHLSAYLDETAFRYKNRGNAYLFRDTLLRLIGTPAMPYRELVASV